MSPPDHPEHPDDLLGPEDEAEFPDLDPDLPGCLSDAAAALADDEATEGAALRLGVEPEELEDLIRDQVGPDILDAAPLETFGAGLLAGLDLGVAQGTFVERERLAGEADPEDLSWLLPLRDEGLVARCALLWVRALRALSALEDLGDQAPGLRQRAALELSSDIGLLEEVATEAELRNLGARPHFAHDLAAREEFLFAAHAAAALAAICLLADMPPEHLNQPAPSAFASVEDLGRVFAADLGFLEDLPSAAGHSSTALMLLVSGERNHTTAQVMPADHPARRHVLAAAEGRLRAAAWAVGIIQGEPGRRGDGFDGPLPVEAIPPQVLVWQSSEWPGDEAPDAERFMACCRRALALSLSLEHLLARSAIFDEDTYLALAGEARTWARRASALASAWASEPAGLPHPAREALWICAAWLGAVAASADQATAARHGLTALPVAPLAERLQRAELAVWFLGTADTSLHEAFDQLRAILPGSA